MSRAVKDALVIIATLLVVVVLGALIAWGLVSAAECIRSGGVWANGTGAFGCIR